MQLPAELAGRIDALLEAYDFKQLRAAAEKLSERYREHAGGRGARPHVTHPLLTSEFDRAAYLAVRFPATYAAVSAVLEEIKSRAPQFAPKTMLDLGTGPGTAVLAGNAAFPSIESALGIDQDRDLLKVAARLALSSGPEVAVWRPGDVRTAEVLPSDLAVLAYSLGELAPTDAAKVIERGWKAAQVLCVIEPGTPRGYATIMRVRDQLIAAGGHLVAPCPHERRCPMDGTKDWCHFAARVERTSLHRRMKSGELGWEDEKFSYVIFSRAAEMARAGARIVRHPQVGKGHIKLELCAQDGLGLVTISKKQGEVYRQARRARWGDGWDI